MTEGTLILVGKKKNLQVQFINKNGKPVQTQIAESQLSQSLLNRKKNNIDELENIDVEFEEVGGQPKKVREKGKSWEKSSPQSPTTKPNKNRNNRNNKKPIIANKATATRKNTTIKGDFHNPYNFIPTPSRNNENQNLGELGDRSPAGHGSYRHDYWSGRISVSLITETPLLIPDAANLKEKENGHKVYDVRVGIDGEKPNLPITSVKGMLRSAYEAITNSRYCIFEKHEDRLAYRMSTKIGSQMIPARVENEKVYLYPGTSDIADSGEPIKGHPMYAAWLPSYRHIISDPNGNQPKHKTRVRAWVEKIQHWRWDRRNQEHRQDFKYWRVTEFVLSDQDKQKLSLNSPQTRDRGKRNRSSYHEPLREYKNIEGFICVTNKNIDNKHDERVFFSTKQPIEIELNADDLAELKKKWQELITNYQEIHKDEIKQGKQRPPALNHAIWSRHITGNQTERDLSDGTLCYARVEKQQDQQGNDQYEILGLYPVIIARELYEQNPADLLPESLKPAESIKDLSPADRVFGWVKQKGKGSYKGNLRIFNLNCVTEHPIKRFDSKQNPDGFPLTILGQPQPQQARFYQAKDKQGNPLAKKQGYSSKQQGLRGRKVYPHHQALPEGYWNNPYEDRTTKITNGYCQEYRQPRGENEKTDQNRSIKAWVKPQVEFTFTLDIINLSSVELGALLWLLSLPENHYHRLGGGKPLGFGSVYLKINWQETDLRNGQDWQQYYSSLFPLDSPQSYNRQFFIDDENSCVKQFENAVISAYGNGNGSDNDIKQVSFISAFLRYTQGFDDNLPTYYPRLKAKREADAEGFKWFEQNERTGRNGGDKLSLPKLVKDRGLPFISSH